MSDPNYSFQASLSLSADIYLRVLNSYLATEMASSQIKSVVSEQFI